MDFAAWPSVRQMTTKTRSARGIRLDFNIIVLDFGAIYGAPVRHHVGSHEIVVPDGTALLAHNRCRPIPVAEPTKDG
jgi:hypothetical protein